MGLLLIFAAIVAALAFAGVGGGTVANRRPKGFIPDGSGPTGARYGRDPVTALAFKSDGTTRQKRRTFSPLEQVSRLREQAASAMGSIGRGVIKTLAALAAYRGTVGTFRKWIRDARAYETAESVAIRRAYFQKMLDSIDAKHEAAKKWLPTATAAADAIDGVNEKVGAAIAAHMEKNNGKEPSTDEATAIVRGFLTPKILSIVEGAADPANDPFAEFRATADEPDSAATDEFAEDTDDNDNE